MSLSQPDLERLLSLLAHSDAGIRDHGAELLRALPRELLLPHLVGGRLSGVPLAGLDLSGADLSGIDLSGMDLGGVNLSGANLSGARLVWTRLDAADLSGALLTGADLTKARMVIADLTGADLTDATLEGAELRGVRGLDEPPWEAAVRWQPPGSMRCYVFIRSEKPVIIGRRQHGNGNIRLFTDDQVAGRHCRILYRDEQWLLHNLCAAGTFVHGLPVSIHALTSGDVLVVGRTRLTFFAGTPPA